MSFPVYPEYKDSGVEWLGEVPSHWEVRRLRFLAEMNPSKTEVANVSRSTGVSFLPMEAVGEDGRLDLERTRPIQEVESGYTYFSEGDVAFAKITPCFENGKGAVMKGLVGGIGFGTTELIVVRPKPDHAGSDYLHWLFSSTPFRKLGEAAMYGAGGQKRVPDAFVRDFVLGVPPLAEQSAIAAFLDRETGKIDALVAEQEKLIELLKEKRQAVISHAVTKGLDPNVPMKDSGVEWLGEVPEHWDLAPLSAVSLAIQTGPFGSQLHAQDYVEDHVPVINPANLQGGGISPNWSNTVLPEVRARLSEYILRYDDIVLSRRGEMGRCAVVEEREAGWLCGTGSLIIRLSEQVVPRFVATFIRTPFVREWLALQSVGSTMDNLNASIASRLKMPVPPKEEQVSIMRQLEGQAGRLDRLVSEAQRAIELLKERRSALISAAVTGKIDVRGLAAAEATEAA
jgi:type I restriction enzyme S subunit